MRCALSRPTSELLTRVVVDTIEKMAFLFALSQQENVSGAATEPLETVEVGFCGPCSGRIRFGLSVSVMRELAGNMLGVEDSATLSIEEQHDALKEIANVVCGNLLPAIGGQEAEFSIGSPQIIGAEQPPLSAAVVESQLIIEGGICHAAIELADCHLEEAGVDTAQNMKGRLG